MLQCRALRNTVVVKDGHPEPSDDGECKQTASSVPPGKERVPKGTLVLVAGMAFLFIVLAVVIIDQCVLAPNELPPGLIEPPHSKGTYEYTDPVTREPVNPDTPYMVELYGTFFYFNSKESMEMFTDNPLQYVTPNIRVKVRLNPNEQDGSTDIRLTKPGEDPGFDDQTVEQMPDDPLAEPDDEMGSEGAEGDEGFDYPEPSEEPGAESGDTGGSGNDGAPSYGDVPPPATGQEQSDPAFDNPNGWSGGGSGQEVEVTPPSGGQSSDSSPGSAPSSPGWVPGG